MRNREVPRDRRSFGRPVLRQVAQYIIDQAHIGQGVLGKGAGERLALLGARREGVFFSLPDEHRGANDQGHEGQGQ